MEALKIIIADDHPIYREGMERVLLHLNPNFTVHQAYDGTSILNIISEKQIDILFMNVCLPRTNGIEVIRYIRKIYPKIKVVGLTQTSNRSTEFSVLKAGANGFINKNIEAKILQNVITTLNNGHAYFPSDFLENAKILPPANPNGNQNGFLTDMLSDREMEILLLICRQLTSKEISTQLNLTVKTVETHRLRIMAKTKAKNMAGLVIYAIQNGYVISEDI